MIGGLPSAEAVDMKQRQRQHTESGIPPRDSNAGILARMYTRDASNPYLQY